MASAKIQDVIMLVVSLVVMGILLPIGLAYIGSAGSTTVLVNGANVTLSNAVDPAVITLLTILVPIVAVVGLLMYFIPKMRN